MRRTSRKKWRGACRRIKEGIKEGRHLPGRKFIATLNRRLIAHYSCCGVRGNSRSLWRFYQWSIECAFKWMNRQGGKRKSFTWKAFR
jgi:RNA-directed DNA polymerase